MTDKKKPNDEKPIEIPFVIPSESPRIYSTGAFGGYTPHDFRIIFYSEEPLEQDIIITQGDLNLVREVQGEVILAPLAAKQLSKWLSEQIKAYEEKFGKIASPPNK